LRRAAAALAISLAPVPLPAQPPPLPLTLEPDSRVGWTAVNDAVMGGVSHGRIERLPDGTVVFSGRVSFEYGGGFASARRAVAMPPVPDGVLRLEVAGDGKRYKLAAYAEGGVSGASWQTTFATRQGETSVVDIPLGTLSARFRGRPVDGAPPLRAEQVRAIGFLIADRQEGPFRLEIRSLVLDAPAR
jgi:hypothetical protein